MDYHSKSVASRLLFSGTFFVLCHSGSFSQSKLFYEAAEKAMDSTQFLAAVNLTRKLPGVTRVRPVYVNLEAMRVEGLDVKLFPDVIIKLRLQTMDANEGDKVVQYFSVQEGLSGYQAQFSILDGVLNGTLRFGKFLYTLSPMGSGGYLIIERSSPLSSFCGTGEGG